MKKKKNTINFEKEKNRNAFKKALKKLRIPIIILVFVSAVLIAIASVGEVRRSNIADSFRAVPATLGESEGYPYKEDELNLGKLSLIGDKPLIVTGNGVEVLSQNADRLLTLHLDWGDTKLDSSNGRAIVYSNTSGTAYLISRTKKLATFNEDGMIITGCVGKNGSSALSFTSKEVQSVVKVYTPRLENVFMWNCSKEYVSSLSLSASGNKVLISAIGVENAEIYSRLILFNVSKDKPDFDITLNDTNILKVIYTSGNRIIAIGNNKTIIYDYRGKQVSEINYSENSLFAVDNDKNGNTLLCYKSFGGNKIRVDKISARGKMSKSFELEYTPSCVDMRGNLTAFSIDNKVITYTSSGKEKEVIECANNIGTCLITDTAIYTLENGSICKY